MRRNATSGAASASASIASMITAPSRAGDFKNRRRAGVLKKRFSTVTAVPTGPLAGPWVFCAPPSIVIPDASPSRTRDTISTRATAAMLGRASPRNPYVEIRRRSSAARILLVANRWNARGSSSGAIPSPSSATRMSRRPAPRSSTVIRRAPASRLFSISSFTTDAGRSTTSPAAIRSAALWGRS